MSVKVIWPEIKALQTEAKHEITLIGDKVAERVSENDGLIDENLYEFGKHLNYVKLSKIGLIEISPKISNLNQLTQLAISDNLVSTIPFELSKLNKLVYLDLSQNKITSVPAIFGGMSQLRTIILRNNNISSISSFSGLMNLQELFLDHNNLTTLPDDVYELEELMTINLSNNHFDEISDKINSLKNLKSIDFEDNEINEVPSCLGQMPKLKQLQLKNNPLKKEKTQLKKLINDNLYKAIFDNLKKNASNTKQKRSKDSLSETEKESTGALGTDRGKYIQIVEEDASHKIIVINRPNLWKSQVVYFIVHNIQFTADKMKAFIKLQEQLHKNECDNRKLLTIGAHDLATVKFPLKYSSKSADSFKIHMMNLNSAYTGRELYERLLKCADAERKTKKRGCPTGVHQYLYLTEIGNPQGVVEDSTGMVVSFPPLTNCNATKITLDTTDVMIELIGSKLDKVKLVGEKIIGWLLDNDLMADGAPLVIEPMRVFEDNSELAADSGEKFLVVFPSRSDLGSVNARIVRD